MKHAHITRFWAMLLSLVMVLSLLPANVFAADDAVSADLTIYTAADWTNFANAVADGDDYSGKTVVLANDIDLGGSEENPTAMAGKWVSYSDIIIVSRTIRKESINISNLYKNLSNKLKLW